MSKIKSALELALERTADVKVDKEAVRKDEFIRRGKSIAGKYLSGTNSVDMAGELSALKDEEKAWARDGMVEPLLANLTLPRYEADLTRLPVIAEGLKSLGTGRGADAKNLDYLLNQYGELFRQYLGNLDQLEEQLTARWEPRLRQKEQQLRQQTGRDVRLTPAQDPEFAKVLAEELSRMDAQYGEVLTQGKTEIRKLLG